MPRDIVRLLKKTFRGSKSGCAFISDVKNDRLISATLGTENRGKLSVGDFMSLVGVWLKLDDILIDVWLSFYQSYHSQIKQLKL